MANGKVKWFDNKKGFGFITRDETNADIFVHHTAIQGAGYKTLVQGDEVTFDVTRGDRGDKAIQVRVTHRAPAK